MDKETIIKYEAYNILQIALKSEDDYEGHHAIIDRLNILIDTLQLEEHIEREGDDGINDSADDEEEDIDHRRVLLGDDVEIEDDVEYTVRIIDDEVVVTAE